MGLFEAYFIGDLQTPKKYRFWNKRGLYERISRSYKLHFYPYNQQQRDTTTMAKHIDMIDTVSSTSTTSNSLLIFYFLAPYITNDIWYGSYLYFCTEFLSLQRINKSYIFWETITSKLRCDFPYFLTTYSHVSQKWAQRSTIAMQIAIIVHSLILSPPADVQFHLFIIITYTEQHIICAQKKW